MRFTKVQNIPDAINAKYKLEKLFDEFIQMNIEAAKIDDYDYKSVNSAYNVLHKAAKRWRVPVKVVKRGEEIYFVRTDM